MQIKLNTDNNIVASESLVADVEKKINAAFKRFSDQITRVDVHLSDLNNTKPGPEDKRCVIEALAAGMNPISVSHKAPTVALAVDGSQKKMINALDAALGKRATVHHDKIVAVDNTDST